MNGQLRIESVFAFVMLDEDGTEGVPAVLAPSGLYIPLMGADLSMVKYLEPEAQRIASQLRLPVALVHFSKRTEQKVYLPDV